MLVNIEFNSDYGKKFQELQEHITAIGKIANELHFPMAVESPTEKDDEAREVTPQ